MRFLTGKSAHTVRESVLCTALIVYVNERGDSQTSASMREGEKPMDFLNRLKKYSKDYCAGRRGSNIPGWALIIMSRADMLNVADLSKWLRTGVMKGMTDLKVRL
jgi:hypothetical protein